MSNGRLTAQSSTAARDRRDDPGVDRPEPERARETSGRDGRTRPERQGSPALRAPIRARRSGRSERRLARRRLRTPRDASSEGSSRSAGTFVRQSSAAASTQTTRAATVWSRVGRCASQSSLTFTLTTHALEAVLQQIDAAAVDAVWCLGDTVGYGPRPNDCCARCSSAQTSASSATTISSSSAS